MTLVLAALANDGAILAADRHTIVRCQGSPDKAGEDDKLVTVAGCAVACSGIGPPRVHVPTFLRKISAELGNVILSPSSVADTLHKGISALPNPGQFSMVVVGGGTERLEFWEATPPNGFREFIPTMGQIMSRGACIHMADPPLHSTVENLEALMIYIFRDATKQLPDSVGPPFDFAVLPFGGPISIKRYPS
jgi:hypothetical protein